MASLAKMTVRVTGARGHSTVSFGTTGRYAGLTTGGVTEVLLSQPVQPTATALVFWSAVLQAVQAKITALEAGS